MGSNKPVLWLPCMLALMMTLSIADSQTFFTNGRYGKRSDLRFRVASRSADERFYGGPRFGRSGAGNVMLGANDFDARNPERFFIGSRYGKRSELEQAVPSPQIEETPIAQENIMLECVPVGFENLYHCERKIGNTKTQDA